MILGMNPKELRTKRNWCAYLWFQKRHWSLVLRPEGEPFQARIVDDFMHNALHCYNAEVPSTYLFLVYEMLVDSSCGKPHLMLSAKTDFDPDCKLVQPLGVIGPASFEDVEQRALAIARGYWRCSFIGGHDWYFATEFAASLGAPDLHKVLADGEAYIRCATDAAVVVGTAGAVVAAAAAAGAAGASVVVSATPTTTTFAVAFILKTVAAAATGVGVIGSVSLICMVAGYSTLRSVLHEQSDGHRASSCSLQQLLGADKCALSSDGGSSMRSTQTLVLVVGCSNRSEDHQIDEPESEAAPACDKEPESEMKVASAHYAAAEPKSLSLSLSMRSLESAMAAGGSRVAPWSTAPSWEQPPWSELQEIGFLPSDANHSHRSDA